MTTRGLLAALAVAAVAMALAAASTDASFPGQNGRIAYDDYTTGQIYTINPDGSKRRQLTNTPKKLAVADPSWSADGSLIAYDEFSTNNPAGASSLWVMDADGSHKRLLTKEHRGYRALAPSFTPSGRQVVFTRCHPEPADACAIWIIRADGTHKHALTPFVHGSRDVHNDFNAQVSPSGRQIVFSRFAAHGIAGQLILMALNGSHAHPITPPKYEAFQPDWSPNGRRITFSTLAARIGSSVFTMRARGGGFRRLTLDHFPNNDAQPAYSPDGDQIVFVSDRRYPDLCCVDLFTIGADGGKDQRIPTKRGGGLLDPAWGTAPIIR
jgi:TolB protein